MHSLIHTKKKKFCFRIPLKYFEFTIEVNGKIGILVCTMHNLAWFGTPNSKPG